MLARVRALAAAAATVLLACAPPTHAQPGGTGTRTLQLDINNALFITQDSHDHQVPFSGLNFTGSFQLTIVSGVTQMAGVLVREGGPGNPFVNQAFTGSLTDLAVYIKLDHGNVIGSYIFVDMNGGAGGGGDTYNAAIGVGGSVESSVGPEPGGVTVDGLTN